MRLGAITQRLDERMRDWRETAPVLRSSTHELVENLRINIVVLLHELTHPQSPQT